MSPPSGTTVETINTNDDPNFVKIAIEGDSPCCLLRGASQFTASTSGVRRTSRPDESLWPAVYTFWRGLSFRAFYFFGTTGVRWGIVLNYVTSQRFCVTLKRPTPAGTGVGQKCG